MPWPNSESAKRTPIAERHCTIGTSTLSGPGPAGAVAAPDSIIARSTNAFASVLLASIDNAVPALCQTQCQRD